MYLLPVAESDPQPKLKVLSSQSSKQVEIMQFALYPAGNKLLPHSDVFDSSG